MMPWIIAAPLLGLSLFGLITFCLHPKKEQPNHINWSPLDSVAVTLFIYFFGQLAGGLIAYMLPMLVGWDSERINNWINDDSVGQFVAVLLIEALTIGLILLFLRRRKSSLHAIGLNRKPVFKDLGYAAMGFAGYFVLYIIAITAAKQLIPALNVDQEQQIGFNNVQSWQLPLVFISLAILPPLVEEIMARGVLYSGLRKRAPRIVAVTITSGLFGVAHLQFGSGAPLLWVAAIDTFILSVVLIYLREKTDSLWSPIFLHGIKNTLAFLFLFVLNIAK